MNIPKANLALAMATIAFAANFSVWTLYSVIGIQLNQSLNLTNTEFGFLLAAPMLTGASMRFPAGLLSEMYSCKWLYALQMFFVVPFLFALPHITSYAGYITVGLLLGISGVSFTLGIRYVTDWFESKHQGFAMGVFGAGNAGAMITLILVPAIIHYSGWQAIGTVYGLGMLFVAVIFTIWAPEVPNHYQTLKKVDWREHLKPLKETQIWRFGLYYYFVFGSFLALLLWLPQYYMDAYKQDLFHAFLYTLIFVGPSSMVRALGGWFADRYGARAVNWAVFWVCLVCLFFLSYPPTTMTIHGVERDVHLNIEISLWMFNILIFVIGIAQGFGRASVYKIIHDYYPTHLGSVGGTVAMVGAAGGFTLPVMFGVAVDWVGIHTACFMLLYGLLAACMILMHFAVKAAHHKQRLKEAIANNFLEQD